MPTFLPANYEKTFTAILWGLYWGCNSRSVCCHYCQCHEPVFADLYITNWFVTIYTVLITSLLFSLGGFINAVYAKSFDDISIIPTFVLTPLTYLGGVFYAISALSPFWQNLSLVNPIVYMVNAFRFGILGHSDVNVSISLVVITFWCAVLYGIAYYLLSRGSGMRE